MGSRRPRERVLRLVALAGFVAALGWLVTAPVASTRQGVDFTVSSHGIALHVKTIGFLHRHYQYQLLARQITRGLTGDEARALAVFDWTRQHIRPTPAGWPVVDDHILDIIIRGYGVGDQMADVFTTLCTYAGVPAFWRDLRLPDAEGILILSFAKIEGRWAIFDVAQGLIFRTVDGALADVAALGEDPALLKSLLSMRTSGGAPYWRFVEPLRPFQAPQTLRAEQQMPFPRLRFEVKRVLARSS